MTKQTRTVTPERTEPTPGPWEFRFFSLSDEDVEEARRLGLQPPRLLGNDGSVNVTAGSGEDRKPIARVECQTRYKRGEGYRTECAERDANARLIAAARELLEAAVRAEGELIYAAEKLPHSNARQALAQVRAAIAKATTGKG